MLLTQINQQKKNKWFYDCFINDAFAFTLSQSELNRLQLKVGMTLSQEVLESIYNKYVFKRAKKKAVSLLKRKDRTKYEIESKLKEARFNDYVIQSVIDHLKSNHLINDKKYFENYVSYYKTKKSLKKIQYDLRLKGIKREYLEMIGDLYQNEESTAYKLLDKKYNIEVDTKEKMMAYLIRKGFKYDSAKKVVEQWLTSNEK